MTTFLSAIGMLSIIGSILVTLGLPLASATEALAATSRFGEKTQATGGGYACISPEFFRELDAALSNNDNRWAGEIGECIYLRDGSDVVILDETGPFYLIRAISPSGHGRRYWVSKRSIRESCFISSGCKN